jgi:hypothetical protein
MVKNPGAAVAAPGFLKPERPFAAFGQAAGGTK